MARVNNFFQELLKNRVKFREIGRPILEFKLTRLHKMDDDEIADYLNYLRGPFMEKYVPEKKPRQSMNKRRYSPVVTLSKPSKKK